MLDLSCLKIDLRSGEYQNTSSYLNPSLGYIYEFTGTASFNLSHESPLRILISMKLKDGSTIVANLTTIGRKTGQPRTVELRLLYFNGKFYATSSKVAGKHWCQNMIENPTVEIKAKGEKLSCTTKQVSDEAFRQRILTLRDSPPQLNRVVFEIAPNK